ncbi:FecR family protein [Sphingobacterium sp. UBA5670]|uniref:FecR family protein n=1 Tax=Sphingobacterium sp. UBA5670 TaxID=1947502 RepID=UPI0025F5DD51|nr:FecR domain-containing protein [Sphingobacterium sp. UBA5670]
MEENNTSRFIPYDLIQKKLDGTISEREGVLLERWISEDTENHRLYDEISTISDDLIALELYKNLDTNSQWDKFKLQLGKEAIVQDQEISIPIRTILHPWMKFVAAAILLIVGFVCYLNFDRWMGNEIRMYGSAVQQSILLPDSSVMVLHAGAEAVFNRRTFPEERIVKLKKGKALFDVKHKAGSSFVVDLENNYVRDIGTTFEVNLLAEDVEVLVKEGIVALSSGKGDHSEELVLQKNQKGLYKKQTASLSKIDLSEQNDTEVAQKLNYSNIRLDSICKDLEKHFRANITVVGDSLKARKLTMYFDGQTLKEIVQILSKTLNAKWKSDKKGYNIYE